MSEHVDLNKLTQLIREDLADTRARLSQQCAECIALGPARCSEHCANAPSTPQDRTAEPQPTSDTGAPQEGAYNGEEMCVCGHIRDEHGNDDRWCLVLPADPCIEFRPVPVAASGAGAETDALDTSKVPGVRQSYEIPARTITTVYGKDGPMVHDPVCCELCVRFALRRNSEWVQAAIADRGAATARADRAERDALRTLMTVLAASNGRIAVPKALAVSMDFDRWEVERHEDLSNNTIVFQLNRVEAALRSLSHGQ